MNVYQEKIDTPEGLRTLVERSRQNGTIALDTEFVWDRTYYPKLGLVQLALSGCECFLVDAVVLEDLTPLGKLIADPDLTKILHDAPQDLTILHRATGAFPRRIFDTRCAAGLAGLGSTTSLRELVEGIIGVDLAKTESRTNWLRRPLSAKQITYAVEDVRYLHEVNEVLLTGIRRLGREEWLDEELRTFDDSSLYVEKNPRLQYHRVKGAGRASSRELAILRELTAWREEEARRRDRPRSRIVADTTLVQLARRKPRSRDVLRSFKGLARRYDEIVLELIGRGLAVADEDCPKIRRIWRSIDARKIETKLERAMAYLRAKCAAADIDPPFVASRAEVKALISDGPHANPGGGRLLRGWRRTFIGQELLEMQTADSLT